MALASTLYTLQKAFTRYESRFSCLSTWSYKTGKRILVIFEMFLSTRTHRMCTNWPALKWTHERKKEKENVPLRTHHPSSKRGSPGAVTMTLCLVPMSNRMAVKRGWLVIHAPFKCSFKSIYQRNIYFYIYIKIQKNVEIINIKIINYIHLKLWKIYGFS